MHKLTDKDKKIWNFYVSSLISIKNLKKKKEFKSNNIPITSKVLKSNFNFSLDNKTRKQIKSQKFVFDAIIDLHGKTEVQAYDIIKKFIKNSYLNNLKSIVIITGKGTNSKGKLK